MHELHDQQLQVLGVAAERLIGRLHARHVAVMVGAPHVDLAVEAALALVLVVGDVGGEVGVLAARAHEHAVLVVAVVGRAQPQGALAAIRVAALLEQCQRMLDRADGRAVGVVKVLAGLVQRALIRPAVEALHAKRAERGLHLPDHDAHGSSPELRGVELRRCGIGSHAPPHGTSGPT